MNKNDNISFLVSLLNHFDYSMLGDEQWHALCKVDASDQHQLARAIDTYLVPAYTSWDAASQQLVSHALSTALASPSFAFGEVLRNVEMPFGPLAEPRQFFLMVQRAIHQSAE